jgi:hypothetical protein
MTDEQINIAIAEACGMRGVWEKKITSCGCDGQWDYFNPQGNRLPDYCNDLNAMHKAEKMLTKEQLYNYGNKLDRITLPKTSMEMCYIESPEAGMYPDLFCATAAQRAEAFLKTIKKWNSDKI